MWERAKICGGGLARPPTDFFTLPQYIPTSIQITITIPIPIQNSKQKNKQNFLIFHRDRPNTGVDSGDSDLTGFAALAGSGGLWLPLH